MYFLFVALSEMTTFPSMSSHEREDATVIERKERHKATAASLGECSVPGLQAWAYVFIMVQLNLQNQDTELGDRNPDR